MNSKKKCLGDDERDRKRKLFSSKTHAISKEKSSSLLINNEVNEESLKTAQDFKGVEGPEKKSGFKVIKTKTKVTSEQKERRSSKKRQRISLCNSKNRMNI